MSQNLNFLTAFAGGILAFLSPCFLPLVPAYLIYITGLSLEELKHARRRTLIHSLLFIFGFTFIFTLFGLAVGWLGEILFGFKDILRIGGGILIVILGAYLAGWLRLPWLDVEKRIVISKKPVGYVGSFFIGMVFALGWSPCIGPVLAAILALAAGEGASWRAAGLLVSFSFGLGLPLLILSLMLGNGLLLIKKLQNYLRLIHFICGLLLILVGGLLIINYFVVLAAWLS